jgi:purine-binding chemotaxis protein CheW
MAQGGQTAEDRAVGNALVFRAGTLLCALQLADVIETMRPLAVRPLAGTPPYVRGVTIMRGLPTPVIDVARLLGDEQIDAERFLAVRTERGPVAFAVGPILGTRAAEAAGPGQHPALLSGASSRLIAGVGMIGTEPLLLLQSMRVVPDDVWAVAAESVS